MRVLVSKQAEEVFVQALQLPVDERESFVLDACKGHQELLREVTKLLDAASRSDRYFGELSERVSLTSLADRSEPRLESERIGHWQLRRLIGRGGMGAVYLAERVDGQYTQKAALKILPVGLRSEDVRARFLAERQILARLIHDNIARLLDGGVTDDGTPYFVMDYIDGVAIDKYCDANKLSVPAILDLVLEICEAVEYAHRNLVVHRDIKPSNILVDKAGVPRLLDFGVAKLLDVEGDDGELTQMDRRPMTVNYASPEMLLHAPVDTTTDVYSLGVLAYRLLTGRVPKNLARLSPGERERQLAEGLPQPASEAVLTAGAQSGEVTGGESGSARHARKRADTLRGDLDLILTKATEKDRERRYGSVGLFAGDIRRWRRGEPITARKPTLTYLASRFVRRHRLPLAIASLIAAMLVTLTITSVRFAVVTQRQAEQIAAERDRAEEIKVFLQDVLWEAEPAASVGTDPTATEILRQGVERLENDLQDRPQLRADLLTVVYEIYKGMGRYPDALPLANDVAALRAEFQGTESEDYAETMQDIAFFHERVANYEDAREYAARSVEIRRKLGTTVEFAESLLTYGRMHHRMDDIDTAESAYEEAVSILESLTTEPTEELAHALVHLGSVKEIRGDLEAAEELHRESIDIRIMLFGDSSNNLIESYYNLGSVLGRLDKHQEAKSAYERAVEISLIYHPLPEGHADFAYPLSGLARAQTALGEFDEAEHNLREALRMIRTHLHVEHPNYGVLQYRLGKMLVSQGDCDAAVQPLTVSIEVLSKVSPDRNSIGEARAMLLECEQAF